MKIEATIDPDDIIERGATQNGRVSIGSDYARKNVRAVVLEAEGDAGEREQLVDHIVYDDAGAMTITADADAVIDRNADQQGRLTIGAEYAGQEVSVGVIGAVDEEREAAETVIDSLVREGEHEAAQAVARVYELPVPE